ncbi:MAG: M20 family metallopeptidase [Thermoplasmata archaeon]|nr:M20 family metallopeptidase [Thermoplasmata archaeon]
MRSPSGPWMRAARPLLPMMRQWRVAFHREPELSNEEGRTRAKIMAALDQLEIPYRTYPGFNGVLGIVGEDRPGTVVALRADMDALPITEATGLPYRSNVPGRMHACGHDVHMSCLLGAAAILQRRRRSLRGPVKLLFQPAEEQGREGGALPFLKRGAFSDPPVDFVVGQHVTPELPVGAIGWRKGPIYAAADHFIIRVVGRGAHAGYPHLGVDAVVTASEIVVGLQTLVSRQRDPVDPVVVSVGMIHGGTRHNVLPDEVTLEGTVRTLRAATRERMERSLRLRARQIAASQGARVVITYHRGYPPTINPAATTEVIVEGLTQEFGDAALVELDHPTMGAEDFSRYLERVPGTFLKLGAGSPSGTASLHSARFAPPDGTLPVGAAALACSAVSLQRSAR